jgi:hypothetical protein
MSWVLLIFFPSNDEGLFFTSRYGLMQTGIVEREDAEWYLREVIAMFTDEAWAFVSATALVSGEHLFYFMHPDANASVPGWPLA